jgi:microcystin degradation protein MlrC
MAKKRIAIGQISHETNVFSPMPTPLQAWRDRGLYVGQEILETYKGTRSAIGAYLEVAEREGWEIIPTVCAAAMPSAPTDTETYAWLKRHLLEPIAAEKPDAVLLSVHGAMMAEGVDDPEGDLARAVKEIIGERPLLLAMDLHGNITPEMCASCDGVFAFDTNPHIDGYERGLESAECLRRIFAGEVRPVVGFAHPPMMPPTINMRTSEGPMVELFTLAREWEAKPGIINVSIFGGFPYCDFQWTGTSIVTTADGDPELARACSEAIAARAWAIREQFLKRIPTPEEAVQQAIGLLQDGSGDRRPVILADVADNPGGGGSGDTTELLRELFRQGVRGVAAAAIWDPESASQAIKVGVGGTAEFRIGGKAEPAYGAPVVVTGTVRAITDGLFVARGPMARGLTWNMGATAVVEAAGIKIVLNSTRIACNDADVFRSVGIDPADSPVLLIKSRGHFRASFEPMARTIIEVDAPGAANPGLDRYTYQRILRPIWPLDHK